MAEQRKMRVILCTGKGGVGKTSVAAASALHCAEMGHRTLVMSTDPVHSLSDSFDIEFHSEPKQITANLWAQETELSQTLKVQWSAIRGYLTSLLAWQGIDEITAEEMAILPGMEELANLLYINFYQNEGKYDTVIVDCAPTGETLRLLSFPEIMHWWMTHMFPIGKKFLGVVHPIATTLMHNVPLPSRDVLNSAEDLYKQLESIRNLLTDNKQTTVRLVMNPEKMVIKETQRTFTYLNLYGYLTDLIIVNRVIPENVEGAYFQGWVESQKRYLEVIREDFSPLPIFNVPLMEQEVVGVPMLQAMAKVLYGDKDPAQFFYRQQVQSIHREDNHYTLNISLPFTSKESINMLQNGDELTIEVEFYRRNIILPRVLTGKKVTGAKIEGDQLKITFEADKIKAKK